MDLLARPAPRSAAALVVSAALHTAVIDGAPPAAKGRAFGLWLHRPGRQPISPGTVSIRADGSGRMISRGDLSPVTPRSGVVTLGATMNGVTLSGQIDARQLR